VRSGQEEEKKKDEEYLWNKLQKRALRPCFFLCIDQKDGEEEWYCPLADNGVSSNTLG